MEVYRTATQGNVRYWIHKIIKNELPTKTNYLLNTHSTVQYLTVLSQSQKDWNYVFLLT